MKIIFFLAIVTGLAFSAHGFDSSADGLQSAMDSEQYSEDPEFGFIKAGFQPGGCLCPGNEQAALRQGYCYVRPRSRPFPYFLRAICDDVRAFGTTIDSFPSNGLYRSRMWNSPSFLLEGVSGRYRQVHCSTKKGHRLHEACANPQPNI